MSYPELHLVSHKLCPYVQRARIVLAEKNIPHKIEFIDLSNKPDWFLNISPLGKVPVLCVDGQVLFESSLLRLTTGLATRRLTQLAERPSVRNAVVDYYRERLRVFFLELDSELGRLVAAAEST